MSLITNAFSGAQAAQIALDTSSQNVSNLMTPGYTRQGALLTAVNLNRSGPISAGNGVSVPMLLRFSDSYKNLQLWQAGSQLGQYTAGNQYLTQLQQVMGDDSSNINGGLDTFFAALNAASVEPASAPLRQQVITAADALGKRFNSLREVLSNQRLAVHQQRASMVTQVNSLTGDIAALNQKIVAMSNGQYTPSGLIDQRDQKIDELAGLIGIQVVEQADGSRTVSLRGGQPLVVGSVASTMNVVSNVGGGQSLKLDFMNESFSLVSGNLAGQLGGLDDFENNTLAPLTQSIIDMASGLATNMNSQLAAGFAMDGTPGKPLFNFDPTSSNAMLTVNSSLVTQDLGFSSSASEPGDSGNLLTLIGLKDQPVAVSSLGSVLLGDAYTQLVGRLGMDSQQNSVALNTAQTVRKQTEDSWKATSGVNSDEEAINLMQYQQMYQANMKVIAVANQLFDSVLEMMH